MLKIPREARCLVPDCENTPELSLGIRLRAKNTNAVWAPETHAYVCLAHGHSGARLTLYWTPTEARKITTVVIGQHAETSIKSRTSAIRTP